MSTELSQPEQTLLAFYRGQGTTPSGYTFELVLGWPDDQWESVHDFIQWVFPTEQRSMFNPSAPVLTPAAVQFWAREAVLRANLDAAFTRWLKFVGLERDEAAGFRFSEPTNQFIWSSPNHNWPRITRVLHCLRTLHRPEEARSLGEFLVTVAAPQYGISEETIKFWRTAAGLANDPA